MMVGLGSFVERFGDKRVLVVGDVMLDQYVLGQVDRISPEAPVPILVCAESSARPGGAANAAVNLAAYGVRTALVGVVGEDQQGRDLRALVAERGVEAALIVDAARPTTVKTRYYARGQQVLRVDDELATPLDSEVAALVAADVAERLADVDCVIVSDYAKGAVTGGVIGAVVRSAAERSVPVLVDPKGTGYERYSGATVVTPNVHELEAAIGRPVTPDTVADAARELAGIVGSECAVVVTRGADGMTIVDGGSATHIATKARAVVDVTGAGDTVIATLAVSLAAGASVTEAATIATQAAAIAVGESGAATVSASALARALDDEAQ